MDNKCLKYEALFTFSDEETLKKHLEECEECRQEQKKMENVSALIGEVRSHYTAKKAQQLRLRAVCAIALLLFSSLSFGVVMNNDELMDMLRYGESLSAEDLGFPVDSYGLLMVD